MNRRPQVLLLGNGLCRLASNGSWSDVLDQISTRKDIKCDDLNMPMPLRAILLTDNRLNVCLRERQKNIDMYRDNLSEGQKLLIRRILGMGFDEILTTNYSYELEMCASDRPLTDNLLKKRLEVFKADDVKQAESRYMLHTYYSFGREEGANHIWHIHGEARKPDSMILGHYFYANLLTRMKKIADDRRNYAKQWQSGKATVTTWVDAFIYGDVYILGFGMDFSEFDMWWLIDRKFREEGLEGHVYWFEPEPAAEKRQIDEKRELLKCLGVIPESCGFSSGDRYELFYQSALDRISGMIEGNT